MKKLRAFTLMELLIGMVLSTVVIGFGMTLYSVAQRQFSDYRNAKEIIMSEITLNTLLQADVFESQCIRFADQRLLCSSQTKSIAYLFLDSAIIRNDHEVKDTFFLAAESIEPSILPGSDLLQSLHFTAKKDGETIHFSFAKDYDARTLMNIQRQDENYDN